MADRELVVKALLKRFKVVEWCHCGAEAVEVITISTIDGRMDVWLCGACLAQLTAQCEYQMERHGLK